MPSTRPEISFDRVADQYDESRGGAERARNSAADIAPYLPGGDVLEIGTGTGIVAAELVRLLPPGSRLAGLDLSAAMLRHARPRLPGRLVRAGAMRLPFPDGVFGAVVAVHVLHLVPDVAATLAEAVRVLRPGGRIAAAHAMPQHDLKQDDVAATTADLVLLRGGRRDAPEQVAATAEGLGLRVVAQHLGTPRVTHTSPAGLADQFEERIWSWLWDLDDEQWREQVAPVVAALRALPDPQRPRRQEGRMTVTILERPEAQITA